MKKFIIIPAVLLINFSCKEFVDPPNPTDRIIAAEVFTDDTKANAAVAGIYGSMINGAYGFSNCLVSIYPGYSADHLEKYNPGISEQEFITNSLNPNNSVIQTFWTSIYQHVYFTNACIIGITESEWLSPTVKQRLLAECRFIRALCYFHLVNLFGDVPLALSTEYKTNSKLPRTSKSSVINTILEDLLYAKNNLQINYISNDRARPNKWTAASLLARVYLYISNLQMAEQQSTEIITSSLYSPLPAVQNTFLKNSQETIWQLAPKIGYVPEISLTIPTTTAPQVTITPNLMQLFEVGDQRRKYWVDSIIFQSKVYYYPSKYKSTGPSNTENYVVFRLTEQYFIRAEARARQNNLIEAIQDLNMIRTRAGLADLPANLDAPTLLLEIEKERQRELFAEWGHRWFDLKRNNRAGITLSGIKAGWQDTDTLYPVPQNEILTNPALTQNTGY